MPGQPASVTMQPVPSAYPLPGCLTENLPLIAGQGLEMRLDWP